MKRARGVAIRQLTAAAESLEESARRIRLMAKSISRGEWDEIAREMLSAGAGEWVPPVLRPRRRQK